MEVFKYVTTAHYKRIESNGRLDPRREDGFVYGLPDDPLVWGEKHTQEIFAHLQKGGISPIILLRFIINLSDPGAFVQEADEYVWFKRDTRRPLKDYDRFGYKLPEIVITRPIPFEEISIVDFAPTV